MTNYLDKLISLAPPPDSEVRSHDWDAVYAALGIRLPSDFVKLVDTYGAVVFDDFVRIYEPDCPIEHFDLLHMVARGRESQDMLWDDGKWVPEVVSDQDRLIMWAGDDNGNCAFWRCPPLVVPEDWPVILLEEGAGPAWEEFPMPATEFLYRMLVGELVVELLSSLRSTHHHATPIRIPTEPGSP